MARLMFVLLLTGCADLIRDSDILDVRIEAQANAEECVIVIEGREEVHEVSDESSVRAVKGAVQ